MDVRESLTTMKSPVDSINKLRDLHVEEKDIMVSFEVISLLTSITQDLRISKVQAPVTPE